VIGGSRRDGCPSAVSRGGPASTRTKSSSARVDGSSSKYAATSARSTTSLRPKRCGPAHSGSVAVSAVAAGTVRAIRRCSTGTLFSWTGCRRPGRRPDSNVLSSAWPRSATPSVDLGRVVVTQNQPTYLDHSHETPIVSDTAHKMRLTHNNRPVLYVHTHHDPGGERARRPTTILDLVDHRDLAFIAPRCFQPTGASSGWPPTSSGVAG
jgi:hypothetical protein